MILAIKRTITILISLLMMLTGMVQKSDQVGTQVIPASDSSNIFINDYKKVELSAHRSGAGEAPQNTLMAFEYCINSKEFDVDIFEFDIHITKDGEIVLLHNNTYDDTSNAVEYFGKENIRPQDYDYQTLHDNLNLGAKFNGGKAKYSSLRGKDIPENLRVVRVGDVLKYTEKHSTKKKPFRYIIEIKDTSLLGMKCADKLYKVLKDLGIMERTIVATSKPDVGKYIAKNYPDLVTSADLLEALLFYLYSLVGGDAAELEPDYSVLQLPYGSTSGVDGFFNDLLQTFTDLGSKKFINYAHKYNMAVQYWTVNNPDEMQHLVDNGADAIMTDYPQQLWELLN
ncbi:MAG: hypothetical protein LBR73_02650 [Oscillospiraceae bacterium]|jgi:glycerophosphoryl diester phosphodiesterase|nr:hypothetical protein [Oscillospiraceae bacterium]